MSDFPHEKELRPDWVARHFRDLQGRIERHEELLTLLGQTEGQSGNLNLLQNAGVPEAGQSLQAIPSGGGDALSVAWVNQTPGRSQVFVTGVTGGGTITNQVFEGTTVPSSQVLQSFESDNDAITLTVFIHVIGDSWQPDWVKVTGAGVTSITVLRGSWTQAVSNVRVYTATLAITDAALTGTLKVTTSDGGSTTVAYTRALNPPLTLTATIANNPTSTGGSALCPLAQTQVSAADVIYITGTAEAHATHVYVQDNDVTNGEGLQGPFTIAAFNAGTVQINCGTGDSPTAAYTVYATVGTGGTPGADFISTGATVDLDQTVPAFSSVGHSYPAGQEALKNVETDTVTITHTNAAAGDTYVYDDNSTGELTIPATTTYAAAKAVTRLSGGYRESGTNYRVTATRTTFNGKSATASTTVKIAHTTPVITITGATTRLGTDNGTSNFLDHTIVIQSSQANLSTYTASVALTAPKGTWQGSWATSGPLDYTRALRVADADILTGGQVANDYTWGACTVKNRAGIEATAVGTNKTYQLGGFAARTLTIPAWPNREADLSVLAVDTTKLLAELLSKGGSGANGGTDQTFDNSPGSGTPDDEVDKFCISNGSDTVDDDGQFYYNKDQAAAIANSSGTAQVIVSEAA